LPRFASICLVFVPERWNFPMAGAV